MQNNKNIIVDEASAGVRLDKFLAGQIPEFSRSEIQKFNISRGDDKPIKLSDKVKIGEEFTVEIPAKSQTMMVRKKTSETYPLHVLFEDDDIIVVNKPRGQVMYPAAGNKTDTLVQNILTHTNLSNIGESARPGVVHRIDKDTSGAVILAKTDAAYRVLTKTFSEHTLVRKYVAFIWGIPGWESADISGNIGRSTKNRQKMTMLKVGGRYAQTHVDVARVWTRPGITEVRCILQTGRTHQIRVHLSAHGFPVLCDPLYGRGTTRFGTVKNKELLDFIKTHSGQMLHAEILELNHPITGAPLKFRAPFPEDIRELVDILENTKTKL